MARIEAHAGPPRLRRALCRGTEVDLEETAHDVLRHGEVRLHIGSNADERRTILCEHARAPRVVPLSTARTRRGSRAPARRVPAHLAHLVPNVRP